MESLKKLYKIGRGPSSSHTMGPYQAAIIFKEKNKNAFKFIVHLYGSLALTGIGHLIDKVLVEALGTNTKILFEPDIVYDYHPNGMLFECFDQSNNKIDEWLVFSVGGGSLKNLDEPRNVIDLYPISSMKEIMDYCSQNHLSFEEYIRTIEEKDFDEYMKNILNQMINSVNAGLFVSGVLPGGLNVERKASSFYEQYLIKPSFDKLVYAASLSVAEENACGGVVVTAPTCGSAGVVPGIIYAEKYFNNVSDDKLINALIVGGLIGNLVKSNGSISGAEVGCQGEVGVACAMAAAIETYLHNGSLLEIEYSAEIALEHHLGMTCDPIKGLVQIPCIERNAIAAMQAYNSSNYAILTSGIHHISLDEVIKVMKKTGKDLQSAYRETSLGGLATTEMEK